MSAGLVGKRAVAHLLYALGLLQLWQAIALRKRAVSSGSGTS